MSTDKRRGISRAQMAWIIATMPPADLLHWPGRHTSCSCCASGFNGWPGDLASPSRRPGGRRSWRG